MVVAITMGMLVIAGLFVLTYSMQGNIGLSTEILGISQKGRLAVNYISKDIREAAFVAASHGGYTTDNGTIILGLPAINASGNVIVPISSYDYVIYTAEEDNLMRITDADLSSARGDTNEVIIDALLQLSFYSEGSGSDIPLSTVTSKTSIRTLKIVALTTGEFMGNERQNTMTTSASLRNR